MPPHPEQPRLRLREHRKEPFVTPLPLHQHPVVAVSIILTAGAIVQIAVWIVSLRLPGSPLLPSSSAVIHGWLFDAGVELISRANVETSTSQAIIFAACLALALLSVAFWYAAVRIAVGPGWALAVGICWAAHPAFAFLAPRPAASILVMLLTVAALASLCWWRYRGLRLWQACLVGVSLGALTLVATAGLLLLPLMLAAVLLAPGPPRRRYLAAALVIAFDLLIVAPWVMYAMGRAGVIELKQKATSQIWENVGIGSELIDMHSHFWGADHRESIPPRPFQFLASEARREPMAVGAWLLKRSWRTLFATSDARLQTPLFVLRLSWMIPALWGLFVALRHPPWRWMAGVGVATVGALWSLAAAFEPLARNLVPAEGLVIAFALIGIADIYERLFHRRLTRAAET